MERRVNGIEGMIFIITVCGSNALYVSRMSVFVYSFLTTTIQKRDVCQTTLLVMRTLTLFEETSILFMINTRLCS